MRMFAHARLLSFTAAILSVLFSWTTPRDAFAASSGAEFVLYTFPVGESPSPLIQASDGNFYGTVSNDGANGQGYIFRLTPGGALTIVYSFTGAADGGAPMASLIEGNDGNLYGTNTSGGLGNGVMFGVTLGGSITVLHDFVTTDGLNAGSLIQNAAGDFFGAAPNGALGYGTVFEYSHAGVFSVVHAFTGANGDGASPNSPLLQASDGLIYGVTEGGGATTTDFLGDREYIGTTYRFDPASFSSFATIASFPSIIYQPSMVSPVYPTFGLTEGTDGMLYGLTALGGEQLHAGDGAAGSLYSVTMGSAPALNFALHYFSQFTDGSEPQSGLTLGGDGNFYGTASLNGPQTDASPMVKNGTIFQAGVGGNVSVLYSFVTPVGHPYGSPIEGSDGNFYGRISGPSSAEIYKLAPGLPIPAPVTVTTNAPTLTLGQSVTLTWQVTNAFSQTAENCYAHGGWSGKQPLTGTAIVTPPAAGSYTYALTCGGVESALSTVKVSPVVTGPTATPVITPNGGIFYGPQSVSIADSTPGAVIYYTTDGSKPTLNSKTWNSVPVVISQTQTIRAIAIASPLTVSSMATATFTINNGNPQVCSILYNQGFHQHSGLMLNHGASVVSTGLFLTHGNVNESTSVFNKQRIPLTTFATEFHFRFKDANANSADGMAFVIQANSPGAVGGVGGNLGYTGIPNSMALKFDLHNNVGEGQNSVGLFFGGDYPGVPAVDLTRSGIDLHSGHTMDAHVTYDGSYLTLNLKDIDTAAQFSHVFPLPAMNPFGAATAYAGFTAATSAQTSTAEIVDWTLQSDGACTQ